MIGIRIVSRIRISIKAMPIHKTDFYIDADKTTSVNLTFLGQTFHFKNNKCVWREKKGRLIAGVVATYFFWLLVRKLNKENTSVADPDPVLFWPLDPGSGIGFFRISDPKPIFLRA